MGDNSSPEGLELYHHEPLPDPSTHVRLLELENPAAWHQHGVHSYVKLTAFPFKEAPPYYAISYTWGDPTPLHGVGIGNCHLRVPRNTADVLDLLEYHKKARYYWIDAICIAQGNIPEKNAQVAFMGDIYRKADHVLVCLDSVEDGAECAMKMIAKYSSQPAVRAALSDLMQLDASIGARFRGRPPWAWARTMREMAMIDTRMNKVLSTLCNVSGGRAIELMTGLAHLCGRPYFGRLWIVQEFLLATRASMVCGQTSCDPRILCHFVCFANWTSCALNLGMNEVCKNFVGTLQKVLGRDTLSTLRVSSHACTLLGYLEEQSEGQADYRLYPRELPSMANSRKCSDPRDTIYGFLALIKWPEFPLKPEYNKSSFRLAVEYCTMAHLYSKESIGLVAQNLK